MHRRDLLRLLSLSPLAGATGCGGETSSPLPAPVPPPASDAHPVRPKAATAIVAMSAVCKRRFIVLP